MKQGAVFTRTQFAALAAKRPDLVNERDRAAFSAGGPPAGLCAPKGAETPVRGRRRKKMNRTEAEFELLLYREKAHNEIQHYGFEEITLRWGTVDPISYTPDFTVINLAGKHIFIEVKGARIWPKDLQKFKAARNQFPHYEFRLWQKKDRQWTRIY